MQWIDACFDTCCYPCTFGPMGLLCIFSGVGSCMPCFMKKYQRVSEPSRAQQLSNIAPNPHASAWLCQGLHTLKHWGNTWVMRLSLAGSCSATLWATVVI